MSLTNFVRWGNWPNGEPRLFGIERVVKWEATPAYSSDGAEYLYTTYRVGVQAYVGPYGLCMRAPDTTFEGARMPGPHAPAGIPPLAAETIALMKQQILEPRQLLTVSIGDVEVLRSPLRRPAGDREYLTDARNGPFPLAFHVLQIHGFKNALVYFEVETHIVECEAPTMLSHRWEETHEIDELAYTTKIITGRAVFRADLLRDSVGRGVIGPDNFRGHLAASHPIPVNFKREAVKVTVTSDGLQLQYTFRDVEQPVNLPSGGPVRKLKGTFYTRIANNGGSTKIDPSKSLKENTFDVGFNAVARYMAWGLSEVTLHLQCWGARTATRQQLINVCVKAAVAFNFADPTKRATFTDSKWAIDVFDKYVELYQTYTVDGNVAQMTGGWGILSRLQNFPEDIPGTTIATNADNPRPPHGGYRGTYIGRVVAQALADPCSVALNAGARPDATTETVYPAASS